MSDTTSALAVHELDTIPAGLDVAVWADLFDDVEELDGHAKSPASLAGYRSDYRQFTRWASTVGLQLPPVVNDDVVMVEPVPIMAVKAYLAARQSDLKSSTLSRHLSAVKHWHDVNNLPSPTDHPEVKRSMSAVTRVHRYTKRQAGALRLADLVGILPDEPQARALLLWGWWSALRRSELVSMNVEDLSYTDAGAVLNIPYSKTDQSGDGVLIGIHHQHSTSCSRVALCQGHQPCPVCALRSWIDDAGIKSGPVWLGGNRHGGYRSDAMSAQSVSLILKAALVAGDMNPAKYSAHSLRAGFVSTMDDHGIPTAAVRAITRHKSAAMLDNYARPDALLRDSAGRYMAEAS